MVDTIQKPKECPRATGGCQSPITLPFRPNSSAILTNRMRYPARMGLLVLLCLWPQVFFNQNLHATPHAKPRPAPMVGDDPDQLFVEAMKLAGSGGRANVDQRLDEACLLWTKRGDPERG